MNCVWELWKTVPELPIKHERRFLETDVEHGERMLKERRLEEKEWNAVEFLTRTQAAHGLSRTAVGALCRARHLWQKETQSVKARILELGKSDRVMWVLLGKAGCNSTFKLLLFEYIMLSRIQNLKNTILYFNHHFPHERQPRLSYYQLSVFLQGYIMHM